MAFKSMDDEYIKTKYTIPKLISVDDWGGKETPIVWTETLNSDKIVTQVLELCDWYLNNQKWYNGNSVYGFLIIYCAQEFTDCKFIKFIVCVRDHLRVMSMLMRLCKVTWL